MPANVALEFEDQEIQAALKQWTANLDKITRKDKKVLRILADIAVADVGDHFDKQMGPDGKWAPWSDSYRKFMYSIGRGSNKILTNTGKLRRGFKKNNVSVVGDEVVFYNDAVTKSGFDYSGAHQEGTSKMPARQHMFLSDKALDNMVQGLLDFWEG